MTEHEAHGQPLSDVACALVEKLHQAAIMAAMRVAPAWIVLASLVTASAVVRAQPPPDAKVPAEEAEETAPSEEPATEEDPPEAVPERPPPEEQALQQAKRVFGEAEALRRSGDCRRALPLYQRSRQFVLSVPNTLNAALCLQELGYDDEALELYDLLQRNLHDQLLDEERETVGAEVRRLRKLVGTLVVQGASDGAQLIIDGRRRAELPATQGITVLTGSRDVRVLKDGYEPFVRLVDIPVGERTELVVQQHLLTVSGRLEVVDDPLHGAELLVDGAPLGVVPWAGSLAPGRHVVQLRQWDVGTAPIAVTVVAGQVARIEPELQPLGPMLRLRTIPADATITIGDVEVGQGAWSGLLPQGDWSVVARKEGYLDASGTLRSAADGRAESLTLRLEVDDAHPLWERPPPGLFWVAVLGGSALAPSLGTGAEASCDSLACSSNPIGVGGLVGARVGFELPVRFSIEATAGYLNVGKSVERTVAESFEDGVGATVPTSYELTDQLRIAGGFVAGGVGYRQPLAAGLELRTHAMLGVAFLSARDFVEGTASARGSVAPVDLTGSDASATSVTPWLAPELSLAFRLEEVSAGIGVMIPWLMLEGPSNEIGDAYVRGECDASAAPQSISCAPGESLASGEALHGSHLLIVPMAHVGYLFQ